MEWFYSDPQHHLNFIELKVWRDKRVLQWRPAASPRDSNLGHNFTSETASIRLLQHQRFTSRSSRLPLTFLCALLLVCDWTHRNTCLLSLLSTTSAPCQVSSHPPCGLLVCVLSAALVLSLFDLFVGRESGRELTHPQHASLAWWAPIVKWWEVSRLPKAPCF